MADFVTDKRFIVGVLVGAFVAPTVLKTISIRLAARNGGAGGVKVG